MDPNANLDEQRAIVRALLDADELDSEALNDALRLAELMQALDDWIAGGGFLPRAWQTSLPR